MHCRLRLRRRLPFRCPDERVPLVVDASSTRPRSSRDIRYTPTDVFETFPQPEFANRGRELLAGRWTSTARSLMIERERGPDEDLQPRARPGETSSATSTSSDASTWRSMTPSPTPTAGATSDSTTASRRRGSVSGSRSARSAQTEILDRLLELNHARYAREQAEQATGAKPVRKRSGLDARPDCRCWGRTDTVERDPAAGTRRRPRSARSSRTLIIGDLLGPAGGEDEEIPGRERVRDRYVLGALAPKDTGAVDPERSNSDEAVEGDDSLGTGDADPAAGGRSLFPSSMGFSCAVDASVASLVATATWGTYEKVTSEGADGDRTGSVWRRSPGGGSIPMPLGSETIGPLVPDASRPDVVDPGPGHHAGFASADLGLPRERAADAAPEPRRGLAVPGCASASRRRTAHPCSWPAMDLPMQRRLGPGAPAARHALSRRGRVRGRARDGGPRHR